MDKHHFFYKRTHNIFYRLNDLITTKKLLNTYQSLLICVSGGQDSIFLIKMLYHLKTKWNWRLAVIHCDHQWNSMSQLQGNHVSQLVKSMNIYYYHVISITRSDSEETARNWRYSVINQIAYFHNYDMVITAHTKNDRIETFLYNLFRGTGMNGLQSISWKKTKKYKTHIQVDLLNKSMFYNIHYQENIDHLTKMHTSKIQITRPLLNIAREDILLLLRSWESTIWHDPTNRFIKISRNRIRHRIIPYLKLYFHPKIDQSIFQWTEIFFYQSSYIMKFTNYLLKRSEIIVVDQNWKQYIALNLNLIQSFPIFLQRQLIKKFVEQNLSIKILFHQIEHIRLRYLSYQKKIIVKNIQLDINKTYNSSIQIILPNQQRLKLNGKFLLIQSSNVDFPII
jgi:tRNA(Ile)-lysidine synthase